MNRYMHIIVFTCMCIYFRLSVGTPSNLQLHLTKIHVDPTTGHFMDSSGRVRMFHGLNSVIKYPPYYDINMRNVSRMSEIMNMGLNILRLGNMWIGWQPDNAGSINNTYVDILEVVYFIRYFCILFQLSCIYRSTASCIHYIYKFD